MSDEQPPFTEVGIVGLGLIGGSVALAARAAWPGIRLAGVDDSPAARTAAADRIVDRVVDRVDDLAGCDLVVVAVPLSAMDRVLPAVARACCAAVVTDVGSTKRQVMHAARAAGVKQFVGGHPMAGSERGGIGEARPDLFAGRPWLLVAPVPNADAPRRVERFVAGLGAVPRWIDEEAHDRAVAYVSHLLQVVSVAIMNAAASALDDQMIAAAAGRAFDEMTRLASSPPAMWQDILSSNQPFVREALARFVAELPAEGQAGDRQWIEDAFQRAAAARGRVRSGG